MTGRLELKHVQHDTKWPRRLRLMWTGVSVLILAVCYLDPSEAFEQNLNGPRSLSPLCQWITSGPAVHVPAVTPPLCLLGAAVAWRGLDEHDWRVFRDLAHGPVCESLLVCDSFSLLTQVIM